jgi:hypothetical protein
MKTSNKISHEDETWTMNNNSMPIVDQTAHIGIQRHLRDSSIATIEKNLKKSRRALYSLMRSGLHGENGLDPVTSISILRTYVIPIMFYGLEMKSYAIFIMVCISCGLLPVSAISSAQVGAQHLMDPIFVPTPAQSKISSK